MEKTEPSAHFVGKKEDLIKAKRSFRTVDGRDILVIAYQGVFYALDYHCYHAAGPLEHGDIEELGGKLCIVCPKHKYKIGLIEGDSIYKVPPKEKGEPPKYLSTGVKQRVHTVTEANGDIYVTLSQVAQVLDSDTFQGPKGKEEREMLAAKEEAEKAEFKRKLEQKKLEKEKKKGVSL